MRTTFMVGTRNRKSSRYFLLGRGVQAPFPGPWRLQGVTRSEVATGHPSEPASRDASIRASRVRSAAPLSTDSAARRTPSDRSRARPDT